MLSSIHSDITNARVGDLRRQADRTRMARAAAKANREARGHAAEAAPRPGTSAQRVRPRLRRWFTRRAPRPDTVARELPLAGPLRLR
jgi:hypothetical protein